MVVPNLAPSSPQIGRQLEDQIELLLNSWSIPYERGYPILTSFHTYFTIDFWLPAIGHRPSVVIEAMNFGVAARRVADSRRRKAQEALYLLVHVRRHCTQTADSRILLVSGSKTFSADEVNFLSSELGPEFHYVPIGERERLRSLVLIS
jgi:hypothetical protein